MEDTRTDPKLKTIFDGFMSLQSETYEFINRTIAMDGWLKEAYRLFQERPGIKAEELYQAWQPALGQVYQHLFASFLRPGQMIMNPFGGPSAPGLADNGFSGPSKAASNSVFSLWHEASSRFMKGYAEATGDSSGAFDWPGTAKSENPPEDVPDIAPLSLASRMAEGQVKVYFDTAKQFLGAMGQDHVLPKSLILNLQKIAETYQKVLSLSQKYETMLRSCCEKAQRKLASQMSKEQKPGDFKNFLNAYLAIMAQEYDDLLKSPDFIKTQNSFIEATSDLIVSLRKAIEARLEAFPFLPFVTSSEMIAVEKNMHSNKRRVDALERRIAELEDKLAAAEESNSKVYN